MLSRKISYLNEKIRKKQEEMVKKEGEKEETVKKEKEGCEERGKERRE